MSDSERVKRPRLSRPVHAIHTHSAQEFPATREGSAQIQYSPPCPDKDEGDKIDVDLSASALAPESVAKSPEPPPPPGFRRFHAKLSTLTTDAALKLFAAGVKNELQFLSASQQLLASCGVSQEKQRQALHLILYRNAGVTMTGFDMAAVLPARLRVIPTSIVALDKVLRGGICTGEIVEVMGSSASGKTQLCMHLAQQVSRSLPNKGSQVLYLDTSGSFSATRVASMVPEAAEVQTALNSIACCNINNHKDLIYILEALCQGRLRNSSNSMPYTMVVLDSFAALFSPLLSRNHNRGNTIITYVGRLLHKLAANRNLVVVLTNYAFLDARDAAAGKCAKPGLGNVWANVPHLRLYLRRPPSSSTNSMRIISVEKSGRCAKGEQIYFQIETRGIASVE